MAATVNRWNWLLRNNVCTWKPWPDSDLLGGRCPICGHAIALHVGVDACVICELQAVLRQIRLGPGTSDTLAADYQEGTGA